MGKAKGKRHKLPNGVAIPPGPYGDVVVRGRKRSGTVISCKGKRRYRDQDEAIRAMHRIQNRSTRDGGPKRAYHCDMCKGWHLTSHASNNGGRAPRVHPPEDHGYLTSASKMRSMVARLRADGLDQRADALEAMIPKG